MGSVDVTDLLSDPDFVDAMMIINRKSEVNDRGENIVKEYPRPTTVGSIQPISGKALARLPEALRVMNVRSFWVRGLIEVDNACKYPDILVYKNKRYTVQSVLDWTNFGDGWCEGVCIVEVPSG